MASRIVSRRFTSLSSTAFGSTLAVRARPGFRFSSTTTNPSALQEFFVVVYNSKPQPQPQPTSSSSATTTTTKPNILQFHDENLSLTFSGEMVAPSPSSTTSSTTGMAFACQAPSEEHVRKAMLRHENSIAGVWDMSTAEIAALETVHTSDLSRA